MKITDLINHLGGTIALARALECRRNSVNMWQYNEGVPAKYHWRLSELAKVSGLDLSVPEIAAMREHDDG